MSIGGSSYACLHSHYVHLRTCPQSLSYTWGKKISKIGITLEGSPSSITENLELLLRRRRDLEGDVAL